MEGDINQSVTQAFLAAFELLTATIDKRHSKFFLQSSHSNINFFRCHLLIFLPFRVMDQQL